MPKTAAECGALQVARMAKVRGVHSVGGVPGLAMQVTGVNARSWILRVLVSGKRRTIGLGPYPEVSLAAARDKAREARDEVRRGIDPVQRKRDSVSELRAAAQAVMTFDECATAYIEAHQASWRSAKHAAQWASTLKNYASPIFGSLQVRDVELPHILKVLEPIWREKNETANRLRGRIELVLDWATARGMREGLNPARWRGHLQTMLPKPSKVKRVEHHPAVPVAEMTSFMPRLRAVTGMGARALEFVILTAARSGEARGARWSEIDLDTKTWTVPADRMKANKEHRVPLSDAALSLLLSLPRVEGGDLVFPSSKGGSLSDMTLSAVLRRMKVNAVPHGFRSSFRDWAAEHTDTRREVAEMALAHSIGSKVEAAYRRGDLLEPRRVLMAEWAAFLATGILKPPTTFASSNS